MRATNQRTDEVEPISFYFDTAEFTPAEIVEMLCHLSTIYACVSGDEGGLKIVGGQMLALPDQPASN